MGGSIRRVFRQVFSKPPTPTAGQTVSAAPVATATTISGASKMAKVRGAGYGTTTVMTEGMDETEANVAKAVLGEGKKKKKYV